MEIQARIEAVSKRLGRLYMKSTGVSDYGKYRSAFFGAALVLLILLLTCARAFAAFPDPPIDNPTKTAGKGIAVLAGGCFWGMEGVFERLIGVTDVVSGYSGGDKATATYERVSTGTTGHAESVRIEYDPSRITFGTLLKVFFSVAHDPTQRNYQGPDHGTQYRSVIFYTNDEQKRIAEAYIASLDKIRVYSVKIVTQVVALKAFYPAEDYHQNIMDNNPDYPYIVFWDKPKVANLESMYPKLIVKK
jgi:peptide-methionine (S)-S-oxide reductase